MVKLPMQKKECCCQTFIGVLMLALFLNACASMPVNELMLMPAPDVFDQGDWDPFTDRDPIQDIPYGGIENLRPETKALVAAMAAMMKKKQ